jgi:hypothetical protein
MKSKWIYVVVLPVTIVAGIVMFLIGVDTGSTATFAAAEAQVPPTTAISASGVVPEHSPTAATSAPAPVNGAQLEHRLTQMQARRKDRVFDIEQVAAAVTRENAWQIVHEAPASLPLKPKALADGRQFIRIDEIKLETLMPGDDITVVVSERDPAYRVRIDSVHIHDGERISWNGHLLDQSERYSVTFTRGKYLTAGGVNTPRGHYSLQSHGEHGWVAARNTLAVHAPHANPLVPPSR